MKAAAIHRIEDREREEKEMRNIISERQQVMSQLKIMRQELDQLQENTRRCITTTKETNSTELERERQTDQRNLIELQSEDERGRSDTSQHSCNTRTNQHKFNMQNIAELLGTFDGTGGNLESGERQIKNLERTYHLDDNATRVLICSRLKGKALTWFHSKPDHIEITISRLLIELEKCFM